MSIALGALAVVLAGLGGPDPSGAERVQISYGFKLVEIRGLDWRAARDHGLRPVASRGGVAVWTAPRDFLRMLPEGIVKEVLAGPRLTAQEQAAAHITTRQGQPFVTQAAWRGDDLPPRENTEQIREGMAATIRGRRLDQGILAYLVIEDTSIHAVHTLRMPAPPPSQPSRAAAKTAASCESACPATAHDLALTRTSFVPEAKEACCTSKAAGCAAKETSCPRSEKTSDAKCEAKAAPCEAPAGSPAAERSVEVQIPEIGRAEIAGEWLIPRDEVLLVSFGPHTVADKEGKALVRERLAVITAEDLGNPAEMHEPARAALPAGLPKPAAIPAPATASTAPLPVPKLPSRTLPQGMNADGTTAKLPPLPEEAQTEEPSDGSSEPRPSPQTRRQKSESESEEEPAEAPATRTSAPHDAKASRASLNLPRGLFRPGGLPAMGTPNLQFMVPLKPFELKLPLNQKLQLELIGRVVPDNGSAESQKD